MGRSLVIDDAPADRLIEAKSLKLYLASFRTQAAFRAACFVARRQLYRATSLALGGRHVSIELSR